MNHDRAWIEQQGFTTTLTQHTDDGITLYDAHATITIEDGTTYTLRARSTDHDTTWHRLRHKIEAIR